MIKTLKIILAGFLIISAFACNNTGKNNINSKNVIGYSDLTEDFISFYESFHSDTSFQFSHISFPMEGEKIIKSEQGDTVQLITWTRENWIIHKRFDSSDNSFMQEFIMVGDNAVIETISALNGLFRIERRYARLSDGWNLIFYSQQ